MLPAHSRSLPKYVPTAAPRAFKAMNSAFNV